MTSKSKHTGVGLALGAALGAAFGVMAGHVGAWLAIGVAIGILLGASFRRKQADCPECAQIHAAHEMRNPSNKLAARS
jgi:lipoprotein signal peptidase